MATTKARQDLRSKFVRNAIPTEQDFKDLIDGQLNQKDDGIFRNPGEPLSIVAGSDAQKRTLRLYGDDSGAAPDWLISLNPGQDPNNAATNRRGFGITNAEGTTRLFIDVSSGNIGIGTTNPQRKLSIAGGMNIDDSDANDNTLANGLVFGRWGSGEGILSKRTPGGNYCGLDFYTHGQARLIIDNDGNIGIGTTTPDDRLDVEGRIRAGALSMGPWPANPANYAFIGSNLQNQNSAGNYALLVGTGAEVGTTYLNGSSSIGLRIGNAQRVTVTGNSFDVIGKMQVGSDLHVDGKVFADGSDLYFTKTDHIYTTLGDTSGYAAIQNAANYGSLMILGRANSPHPTKPGVNTRVVKLWDFLEVHGEMSVTGSFFETRGAGNERSYMGGDGGGNDVQFGSLNPGVQNASLWNQATGKYMTFYCLNLVQTSDLTLKSNVTPIKGALQKVCALRGVRFDWRSDEDEDRSLEISSAQQIGLVAQEVEQVLPEVVTENRGVLGVSYTALIPFLIEAVKELQIRTTRLESGVLPGQGLTLDAST